MKNNFVALFVGIIFSLGLGISGMTNPNKVIGFLDIFGNWNPALMFVMLGAIGVHMLAQPWRKTHSKPLWAAEWSLPTQTKISSSLVVGAFIFGTGWGLAGYCPGPAITSLSTLSRPPFAFVAYMILGMLVCNVFQKKYLAKSPT